jgi:hypothetical protein
MSRETSFRILAFLFLCAAVYHAIAFIAPALGQGGAHWRHAAFVGIDTLFAWYLLRRPLWFLAAFAALTLETFWSHGTHAWMLWHAENRLDGLSFAVLLVVPCTLALLIGEAFDRRSGPRA